MKKSKSAKNTKTYKRLIRPKEGRILGGVCSAFADFFGLDVTIVRLVWVLLLIPGGLPGLIPYIVCWVVIPEVN